MAHDEVALTVLLRHVDLDLRRDAEAIRADVERNLQDVGWDAEVSIDATILSDEGAS